MGRNSVTGAGIGRGSIGSAVWRRACAGGVGGNERLLMGLLLLGSYFITRKRLKNRQA